MKKKVLLAAAGMLWALTPVAKDRLPNQPDDLATADAAPPSTGNSGAVALVAGTETSKTLKPGEVQAAMLPDVTSSVMEMSGHVLMLLLKGDFRFLAKHPASLPFFLVAPRQTDVFEGKPAAPSCPPAPPFFR